MARIERVVEKIDKLGKKQNLDALVKMADDADDEVRAAVAQALGQIKSYESGTHLIPLLRDTSSIVRAAAAEAVGNINAKHCEEYVKKLAFADADPSVRQVARESLDKIRTRII